MKKPKKAKPFKAANYDYMSSIVGQPAPKGFPMSPTYPAKKAKKGKKK